MYFLDWNKQKVVAAKIIYHVFWKPFYKNVLILCFVDRILTIVSDFFRVNRLFLTRNRKPFS
jgi:hypothetical protein